MDLKDELNELVKEIKEVSKDTQEQMSVKAGYGETYISECLSPSSKPSSKFIKALRSAYKDSLEKPKSDTTHPIANSPVISRDFSEQAILKLIDQTDILARANAQAIATNSKLANTNEKLVNRALNITESDAPQTLTTFDAKTRGILAAISEFVVGKNFESSEEFLTEANRLFHGRPQDIYSMGTQKD